MTTRKLAPAMPKTQDRTVTDGKYKFDEAKHVHTFEGKPLMGVTTILKVIGKGDALVQWSANETTKYIRSKVAYAIPGKDGGYWAVKPSDVEDAGKAWKSNRDKAGNFGSNVHSAIEQWIKNKTNSLEVLTNLNEMETKAVNNFFGWVKENNITFLECEKHVYSKKMWVGGILDLVFEKDGKIYVGDIKTSSGIYPEYFFQMAAYDLCINEMHDKYKDIDGYTIINLKKTGQIEVETNYGRDQNKEAFKAALTLHKILQTTKKTI